jgi:hypothetical protein
MLCRCLSPHILDGDGCPRSGAVLGNVSLQQRSFNYMKVVGDESGPITANGERPAFLRGKFKLSSWMAN